MNKQLSKKYSQKLLHSAQKSTKEAIKTASKRGIQKPADAAGDLIGKKLADKITSISKTSSQKCFKIIAFKNRRKRSKIVNSRIVECQKIVNLLGNTLNQMSKFRAKSLIEINDQSRGEYNTNSNIRSKNTMMRSSFCNYSNAYILVKGKIAITGEGTDAAARQEDARDKGIIFKNCAPFINCKSEINNTEIDNAKDIDIVMLMCNLIEYNDNYTISLWQYYKDESYDNNLNLK